MVSRPITQQFFTNSEFSSRYCFEDIQKSSFKSWYHDCCSFNQRCKTGLIKKYFCPTDVKNHSQPENINKRIFDQAIYRIEKSKDPIQKSQVNQKIFNLIKEYQEITSKKITDMNSIPQFKMIDQFFNSTIIILAVPMSVNKFPFFENVSNGNFEILIRKIKESPNKSNDLLILKGVSYLGIGDYKKSLHIFSKIINIDPQDLCAKYNYAVVLFSSCSYNNIFFKASSNAIQLCNLKKSFFLLYNILRYRAIVYYKLNDIVKAASDYEYCFYSASQASRISSDLTFIEFNHLPLETKKTKSTHKIQKNMKNERFRVYQNLFSPGKRLIQSQHNPQRTVLKASINKATEKSIKPTKGNLKPEEKIINPVPQISKLDFFSTLLLQKSNLVETIANRKNTNTETHENPDIKFSKEQAAERTRIFEAYRVCVKGKFIQDDAITGYEDVMNSNRKHFQSTVMNINSKLDDIKEKYNDEAKSIERISQLEFYYREVEKYLKRSIENKKEILEIPLYMVTTIIIDQFSKKVNNINYQLIGKSSKVIPFFGQFGKKNRIKLLQSSKMLHFKKHEIAFDDKEGQKDIVVVLKGSIYVYLKREEFGPLPILIATLFDGEHLSNEMIKSHSGNLKCVAGENTIFLAIDREIVKEIIHDECWK